MILLSAFSPLAQAVDLLTTAEKVFYTPDNTRVGIEVEFSGLSAQKVAEVVSQTLGGFTTTQMETLKTSIKEIRPDGTRIYNELSIEEYVVHTKQLGKVLVKPETNQVTDASVDFKNVIVELVTEPIREHQSESLQQVMDALKKKGAQGTSDTNAVATQMNTEIAEGHLERIDWRQIVNVMRSYVLPNHRRQIEASLDVPRIRRKYVRTFSKGLQEKILDPRYRISGRGLYDDVIYRQSLEVLGFKDAWTMPIAKARQTLLAQANPIVPQVVKQTALRLSSLLMFAFPDDPMTKIIHSSGWAVPRPLIEWREWNTNFNVKSPFKQAIGLLQAAKSYGYYDHDKLIYSLAGIEEKTVRKIRQASQAAGKDGTVLFRYYLADPKNVDRSEYTEMTKAYDGTPVGFMPLFDIGTKPLHIPGESIVVHRIMAHRYNVLGKYNPTLINFNIVQALENKYTEALFWNDYAPGVMPETILLESTVGAKDSVRAVVQKLNQRFPKGWVLKGVWDLGTEKNIVTDKVDVVKEVEAYLQGDFDLYRRRLEREFNSQGIPIEYLLMELAKHPHYKGWKIHTLLQARETTIVQSRVDIAREFRGEVFAGHVLGGESTVDRYMYEYELSGRMSEYKAPPRWMFAAAEKFVQNAVDSLPAEFRNMTFGMDIAVLRDKSLIMIESNPGANSSFLYEVEAPSVRALRERVEQFPKLVREGKVHLGLSPEQQMTYLKRKFASWQIDISKLYSGFKFLEDRIVDSEFRQLSPNPNYYQVGKEKTEPAQSVRTCRSLLK
ncbi:MAG: amidoligase family protein [Bdellovibrionales bacterium]